MPGFDEAVEHVHNDVVKADKPQLLSTACRSTSRYVPYSMLNARSEGTVSSTVSCLSLEFKNINSATLTRRGCLAKHHENHADNQATTKAVIEPSYQGGSTEFVPLLL